MADIDSEFWPVIEELTQMVWATDPHERLGMVEPYLIQRFGPQYSKVYSQIEGTVLRLVILLESFRDLEDLTAGGPSGPIDE